MSVTHLANLIAVSPRTLRDWESGKRLPRANKLQILAGVLGIPLLQLIEGGHDISPTISADDKLAQLEMKLRQLADKQKELQAAADGIASEIASLRRSARYEDKMAS